MRRVLTGRVGHRSFTEALRTARSFKQLTLFIHNGSVERVTHFSDAGVWHHASGTAAGAAAEGDSEAQAARAIQSLTEPVRWSGAPFEICEGAVEEETLARFKLTPVPLTPTRARSALEQAASSLAVTEIVPLFGQEGKEPNHQVDRLLDLIPTASGKQVLLKELVGLWVELGSPRRVADAWRSIAAHTAIWGFDDLSLQALENAAEASSWDVNAAIDLIRAHLSLGKTAQAEAVAESSLRQLDTLKLHDAAVEIAALFERPPESMEVRRLLAEARFKTGDTAGATKELRALATLMESKRAWAEAAQVYQRIAAIDPQDPVARARGSQFGRRERLVRQARRLSFPVAAAALLLLWLGWDLASASALAAARARGDSMPPRAASELLTLSRTSYPISGHPGRVAAAELALHQRSFAECRKAFAAAVALAKTGDVQGAVAALREIQEGALLAPLSARASSEIKRLEERQRREEDLLTQAAKHIQNRNLEAAFQVYREVLSGEQDAVLFLTRPVPVRIESVPAGATMTLDGKVLGAAPQWVFLSSDPRSTLRLERPGFEDFVLTNPLGQAFREGSPLFREALKPRLFGNPLRGGGAICAERGQASRLAAVLGADGVLRGLDVGELRILWEAPLDPALQLASQAEVFGPAVILATRDGLIASFALATGKMAWQRRFPVAPGTTSPIERTRGSLWIRTGEGRLVLNPQTGLLVQRVPVPGSSPRRIVAWRDETLAWDQGGDLHQFNVRTGDSRLLSPRWLKDGAWLETIRDVAVAGRNDGSLVALRLTDGAKAWETRAGDGAAPLWLSIEGRLVTAAKGGAAICREAQDGKVVWQAHLAGTPTAMWGSSAAAGHIVVQVERGRDAALLGVSLSKGRILWEIPLGREEAGSALVLKERTLVSASSLGVMAFQSAE